jgi:hypothetical protein
MGRVRLLGLLGLMAASLGAAGLYAPAEDKPPIPVPPVAVDPPPVDPKMSHFMDCAKACDDCARICDLCANHCVKIAADGKKEHLETFRTCQDWRRSARARTARPSARPHRGWWRSSGRSRT